MWYDEKINIWSILLCVICLVLGLVSGYCITNNRGSIVDVKPNKELEELHNRIIEENRQLNERVTTLTRINTEDGKRITELESIITELEKGNSVLANQLTVERERIARLIVTATESSSYNQATINSLDELEQFLQNKIKADN